MRRWLRWEERGQSLVEFAMVVPIFLLLVFAIIDFGRLLMNQVTLTNATREGARIAAVGASSGEVTTRVQSAASGMNPSVNYTPATIAGENLTVNATATVNFITPMGAIISMMGGGSTPNSFTLSSTASMRRE
jgi:Flp pilus assembly protein TadG